MNKARKILVLRSDGLGDFILSLPAMQALRQGFPGAYITLFTSNWQEKIAHASGLFNEVIIWDNSKNRYLTEPTKFRYLTYRMLKFIPYLRKHKFDLGIDFKDDLRNRLIMRLCGIGDRLGVEINKNNIHKSVLFGEPIKRLLGISALAPYKFNIPQDDREAADLFLEKSACYKTQKIVVIHPIGRWEAKTWALESNAELCDKLLSLDRVSLIFVGAPEDLPPIKKIEKLMDKVPIVAAGELDFLQTAAVIEKAALFVGIDAAPMLMADMLNVPAVALFGATDPKVTRPLGEKSKVIRKIENRCTDCFKKKPGICLYPDNFCMDKISVDEVFQTCKGYLT